MCLPSHGSDPGEKNTLLIFTAALLAGRHHARGLKLNHPKAMAPTRAALVEGARDGRSVTQSMHEGKTVLARPSNHDDRS